MSKRIFTFRDGGVVDLREIVAISGIRMDSYRDDWVGYFVAVQFRGGTAGGQCPTIRFDLATSNLLEHDPNGSVSSREDEKNLTIEAKGKLAQAIALDTQKKFVEAWSFAVRNPDTI